MEAAIVKENNMYHKLIVVGNLGGDGALPNYHLAVPESTYAR